MHLLQAATWQNIENINLLTTWLESQMEILLRNLLTNEILKMAHQNPPGYYHYKWW